MKMKQRILSVFLCLVIIASALVAPPTAYAGIFDTNNISASKTIQSWINKNSSLSANAWLNVDSSNKNYTINNAQKYYTNVTSSTVDSSGNVTNYYRSGDTTNTKIIDSYNKTFNTIHNNNTNNSTTNNYKANVELSNFLNQYTTNNRCPIFACVCNHYTYNTTNNNYKEVGDVTNVYYYELEDGRNSSTLTTSEAAHLGKPFLCLTAPPHA